MDIKESDWKVFRRLRELALERYCQRAIADVRRVVERRDRGHHERYLQLWKLLRKHDETIGIAFDDPRRSRAVIQLANIDAEELLTEDELKHFSEELQAQLESIRSGS
jgi:hypothetical protein